MVSRIWELFKDLLARPLLLMSMMIVPATAVFAISMTAGRTAAAEEAVLHDIEGSASRTITVSAVGSSPFPSAAVMMLSNLEPTEWSFALSSAKDGRTIPVGLRVPVREYIDGLPTGVHIVKGRTPELGEAMLIRGPNDIPVHYSDSSGAIELSNGRIAPVVGSSVVDPDLHFLEGSILVRSDESEINTLVIQASSFGDVSSLVDATERLHGLQTEDVEIRESGELAEIRQLVSGTLGRFSRSLLLYLAGGSGLMVGSISFLTVTMRKQDFGRRRALGASRRFVSSLIIGQALTAGVAGSIIGGGISLFVSRTFLNEQSSLSFMGTTVYLVTLLASCGAIPAAVAASVRDPVRVLRVA